MSSLQKFHRRTQSVGAALTWPPIAIGDGDATHGYWMGTSGSSKLIVSPTQTYATWGNQGTNRNVRDVNDGLSNTGTLVYFGGHPAADWCKNLTTGGYNTWYLPANNELLTIKSNISTLSESTPYKMSGNPISAWYHWTSTEIDNNYANVVWAGGLTGMYVKSTTRAVVAARRY